MYDVLPIGKMLSTLISISDIIMTWSLVIIKVLGFDLVSSDHKGVRSCI